MTDSSVLHPVKPPKRRPLGSADFAALLNALPQAALLVDLARGFTMLANTRLAEMTTSLPDDLAGLPLANLLTNPDNQPLPPLHQWIGRAQNLALELVTRSGRRLPVAASLVPLPSSTDLVLITIEAQSVLIQHQVKNERQQHLWDALYTLGHAASQNDLQAAYSMAMQAGIRLTGAAWIGLYQADSSSPILYRTITSGDLSALPERIAPQDLIALHKPLVWNKSQRSVTQLHRQARLAKLAYVASAPIGQPEALIGLLVAAGTTEPYPDDLLEILKVLAEGISALSEANAIRTAHAQLRAENSNLAARYTTVINATSDSILALSPEQVILGLNASAEQALGYTPPEIVGHPVEDILISTTSLLPALQAAQNSFPAYQLGVVKLYRRNGQAFSADMRILRITDPTERETLLIIFQDLSEKEDYMLRNQQLEQRATLGEVTASFAHEVRNPINNISTGLQLMTVNLPEEDPNQETLKRLSKDCDRLSELVKSGLSFVRPMEYHMEPVDLGPALRSLFERWEARLMRLNIKHRLQVDPGLPPINGDIRALEQVIGNLVNNAMQAMEKTGGLLAVKARLAPSQVTYNNWDGSPMPATTTYVEISISDTGPGIPQDIRDRIFEPFFTTKTNGTGLGLAIVKRIVTAHKGVISVTSIPGGTIFHLQLPAVQPILQENVL